MTPQQQKAFGMMAQAVLELKEQNNCLVADMAECADKCNQANAMAEIAGRQVQGFYHRMEMLERPLWRKGWEWVTGKS